MLYHLEKVPLLSQWQTVTLGKKHVNPNFSMTDCSTFRGRSVFKILTYESALPILRRLGQPEGRPSSKGTPMSLNVIMMASPVAMDPNSLQIEKPKILSLYGTMISLLRQASL